MKDGYEYVRCVECGLVRLDPVISQQAARALYDEGYFRGGSSYGYLDYEADERLHRVNAVDRLGRLATAGARPPGRLVDVGCAHGFFLDEARAAGWEVAGVEISPEASRHARERLGIDVVESLADVERTGRPVDVVTMFQVLEHLTAPREALEISRRILCPGGVLLIETWDLGSLVARLSGRHWQQVSPPSVVTLYDRATLTDALRRAGFRVGWIRRTGKRVSAGFVGSLVAGKYPSALGWVGRVARYPQLRDRTLRYGLGDLMTVAALADSG